MSAKNRDDMTVKELKESVNQVYSLGLSEMELKVIIMSRITRFDLQDLIDTMYEETEYESGQQAEEDIQSILYDRESLHEVIYYLENCTSLHENDFLSELLRKIKATTN